MKKINDMITMETKFIDKTIKDTIDPRVVLAVNIGISEDTFHTFNTFLIVKKQVKGTSDS